MLRTAPRYALATALVACGTLVMLVPTAHAAKPCRCSQTQGSAHASHATTSPAAAPAAFHAHGPHVHGGAALHSAGGYGPAPYGPAGPGPGIVSQNAMVYGHLADKYAPNCRPQLYGNPDLFRSYWVPPTCGGAGAELYPAPYAITPLVGHTYYTYQPFAPHELLYPHHRTYHRYYNGGRGLTRAKVTWSVGPLAGAKETLQHFRLAR